MDKNTLIDGIKKLEDLAEGKKDLYRHIIEEVHKDGGGISPTTVKRCAKFIDEYIRKGGGVDE